MLFNYIISIYTNIYTPFSGVYNVTNGAKQFTVSVAGEHRGGLRLRGDILVKCYHRQPAGRDHVFSCQFHTCAVSDYTLSFTRPELDMACSGKIIIIGLLSLI